MEFAEVIGELIPKKALPNSAIEFICKLFNGIINLGNYPRKLKNLLS